MIFVLLPVVWLTVGATAIVPRALVAPECVACRVDPDAVRRTYSADEWTALTAGKIVLSDVSDRGAGTASQGTVQAAGVIPHPPARVWETLVDFASRPRFQPGTKEVRVERVVDNRIWVAQHLRFFMVDVRFTIINTADPGTGTLSWVLDDSVPHDIAGTRGSWQLIPLADGRATLLVYRAWNDTGRYIPAFVEQSLLERSLPDLIGSFRDEVERRFRVPVAQ